MYRKKGGKTLNIGFDPTYKELKCDGKSVRVTVPESFDPTYKELKS